ASSSSDVIGGRITSQEGCRMSRRISSAPIAALLLFAGGGCEPDLDTTRTPARREGDTFGAVLYGEACGRVAWLSQLDERTAGLRTTVDATGQAYAPVCLDDMPAPADAPRKLQALQSQRAPIVAA